MKLTIRSIADKDTKSVTSRRPESCKEGRRDKIVATPYGSGVQIRTSTPSNRQGEAQWGSHSRAYQADYEGSSPSPARSTVPEKPRIYAVPANASMHLGLYALVASV